MKPRQPYALVDIRWMPLPSTIKYPGIRAFGLTGYREADGPAGIFSVYVKTLGGDPGPGASQAAKMYALADEMQGRLPEIAERFLLTAGATVVAECVTRARGEDDPEL